MIPDFQSLMLPLLKLISDGNSYELKVLVDKLGNQYNLTQEERNELLPSGQALVFPNRVAWARAYLKQAELIEAPKRGVIKIADRGSKALSENLTEINIKYLSQFPEFIKYRYQTKDHSPESIVQKNDSLKSNINEATKTQTPEELIEVGYQSIRKSIEESFKKCCKVASAGMVSCMLVVGPIKLLRETSKPYILNIP